MLSMFSAQKLFQKAGGEIMMPSNVTQFGQNLNQQIHFLCG